MSISTSNNFFREAPGGERASMRRYNSSGNRGISRQYNGFDPQTANVTILRRTPDQLRQLDPAIHGNSPPCPDSIPAKIKRTQLPVVKSTHRRPAIADQYIPPKMLPPKTKSESKIAIAPNGQHIRLSPTFKNYESVMKELPSLKHKSTLLVIPPEKEVVPSEPEPVKSLEDITSSFEAYDSTPIFLVPKDYRDVVALSFKAGMYGVDTESDYTTGELRIIQVYNGESVYIFTADALNDPIDNGLIKFFKSKDRIKVGVDLDSDIYKIKRYVHSKMHFLPAENAAKFKFTINGTIDLQSIARSLHETIFSLDKLSHKYVECFKGNPSDLGTYLNPTESQYIYAANDAILSLKIYQPLIDRKPCNRWLALNPPTLESQLENNHKSTEYEEFCYYILPLVIGPKPRKLTSLVKYIVNSYKDWQTLYNPSFREEKAIEYLEKMNDCKLFDVYSTENNRIGIKHINAAESDSDLDSTEEEEEVVEESEEPDELEVSEPLEVKLEEPQVKTKASRRKKKNKNSKKKKAKSNPKISRIDEIDQIISSMPPIHRKPVKANSSDDNKDENLQELRRRLHSKLQSMKNARSNAPLENINKVIGQITDTMTNLEDQQESVKKRLERCQDNRKKMIERFENLMAIESQEDKAKLAANYLIPDAQYINPDALDYILDTTAKSLTMISDDDYFTILEQLSERLNGEITPDKSKVESFIRKLDFNVFSKKLATASTKYSEILYTVSTESERMSELFPNRDDKMIASNAFINLALDNEHLSLVDGPCIHSHATN